MEQIVLYLAVLAALSGFGMGLMNIAGPFLKRRDFKLPALRLGSLLRRSSTADEDGLDLYDEDDDDGRDFAQSGFAGAQATLLARRNVAAYADADDLDEELADVLDEVAAEEFESEAADNEGLEEEGDGAVIYTVSAGTAGEDEDAFEGDEFDSVDEEEDDEEDGDEEDEEGAEEEAAAPEVHVVAAAGGGKDDMMSFFDEAAGAGAGAIAAWRADLPEVTIEELLAEARAISQRIKGAKRNAA